MTCEEFLNKLIKEGVGDCLIKYDSDVELEGDDSEELASAWKLANLAVQRFEQIADLLIAKNGWKVLDEE